MYCPVKVKTDECTFKCMWAVRVSEEKYSCAVALSIGNKPWYIPNEKMIKPKKDS